MKNEFIPYKESLILKDLGFNEVCFGFYNNAIADVYIKQDFNDELRGIYKGDFEAPLYQQAFKWLWNKTGKYIIPIQKDDKEWLAIGIVYKTYEEAELECLKKLIEIVKTKL